MSTIRIGDVERRLEDADPQWIQEQLGHRRDAGQEPCVRISLHTESVDVALTTQACGRQATGRRRPNGKEQQIFDLWAKHKLGEDKFTIGHLVAFVKQVTREV